MRTKSFIIFMLGFQSIWLFAQDIQLTQFFAAPLYLSPALTGSTSDSRIVLNHRTQWPSIHSAYTSYLFSFDHNFQKKNSAIGLLFLRDVAGTSRLGTTGSGFSYSYKIQLNRNSFVKAGASYMFYNKSIDYSKLLFQTQIVNNIPVNNSVSSSTSHNSYIDFSASVMTNIQKVWFGITIDHLLSPNTSVSTTDDRLPRKYSLFGGIKFKSNEQLNYLNRNLQIFNFAFLYKQQAKFKQFDLGFYWYEYPILIGLFFRGIPFLDNLSKPYASTDAISLLAGYKIQKFYIGYNYDYTISKLASSTGGTHELAIIYLIKFTNDRIKVMECPEFF